MESITDELREWFESGYVYEYYGDGDGDFKRVTAPWFGWRIVIEDMLDRIDAEYEKAVRELNDYASDSVLLPRDADGEVIHIGDVMERGEARGRVIALMLSNYPKKWGGALHWAIQLEGEHAPTALDGFFHHYHEPTVEDVLDEMLQRFAEDSYEGGLTDFIASYATKLQLKEGR